MTTFESALYYANPGQERQRLWCKEQKPEIELKFKDMKRDINADLGQKVREILRQTPNDHRAIMDACQRVEEAEDNLARLLNEGVEAEAARLKTAFMHSALNHPGEPVSLTKKSENVSRATPRLKARIAVRSANDSS